MAHGRGVEALLEAQAEDEDVDRKKEDDGGDDDGGDDVTTKCGGVALENAVTMYMMENMIRYICCRTHGGHQS